jgi:hypothetical protein
LQLDFLRSRRGRWSAIGGALVLFAIVVAWLTVPRVAAAKVRERVERLGMRFESRDTSMGFSGLRFDGVTIATAAGTKVADVSALDIELAWFKAVFDPRAAIERVSIERLVSELSLADVRELRSKRDGANEAAVSGGSAAPLPTLEVRQCGVTLKDAQGVLVRVQGADLTLAQGQWRGSVARVELGSSGDDHIALTKVSAGGPLEGRRPHFQSAEFESAELRWRARGEDSAAAAGPGLVGRLRQARAALRGESQTADEPQAKRSRLWTSDAKLLLKSTRALEVRGNQQEPILERLRVELLAEGDDALRVKGDGRTATGGTLQWNMRVSPSDAQLEGRVALREVPLALFAPALPKLPFHELDRTRVGADLAITGKGLQTASVRGELSISDLAFESERLARAPVGPVSFTARGQGTWTPARRELSDVRGEVVVGAARVLVSGGLAWPADGYRVELRAELPKSKCEDVFATVPAGLLDELAAIRLSGDVKAKVDVLVDSANLDGTKLDFDIADKCRFVSVPELMSVQRFSRPFTHRVLEPDGSLFEMETGPGTPSWTPIELISPFMIQAAVAHEDGRFFHHHGFAEPEIGAALARNLKAKAFKFGASTITMQLVKNVFLQRDKLLSRKFQEALIVWWLEQHVDKKWILELYLNVIEYGTSIYGIRNAALHYFGTLPIHLTPAQAAFFATILPSPKAYDEQYARGFPSESTKQRMVAFLKHMRTRERIDDEALAFGLEQTAQLRFYDPDQPPPVPSPMRGSALAPPFQTGAMDGWNTFDPNVTKVEDGSFGPGL